MDLRIGDVVAPWYSKDLQRAFRIDDIRVRRDKTMIIIGRRLTTGTVVAWSNPAALVVEFRPMNDNEIFWCAESIARGETCLACGQMWLGAPTKRYLDHLPDCRYTRSLNERAK